ncbi:hypothetical protein ACFQRK_08170 [Parapedobacter sp. GCM10030251]
MKATRSSRSITDIPGGLVAARTDGCGATYAYPRLSIASWPTYGARTRFG